MTLQELQERFLLCPPFLCRLKARKARGQLPMSHSDIAKAAQIPRSTVVDLSLRTDWDGIPMNIACRFAMACGVNPLNPKQEWKSLLSQRKGYLRFTDGNQRRFEARLWALFATHFKLGSTETADSQRRAA